MLTCISLLPLLFLSLRRHSRGGVHRSALCPERQASKASSEDAVPLATAAQTRRTARRTDTRSHGVATVTEGGNAVAQGAPKGRAKAPKATEEGTDDPEKRSGQAPSASETKRLDGMKPGVSSSEKLATKNSARSEKLLVCPLTPRSKESHALGAHAATKQKTNGRTRLPSGASPLPRTGATAKQPMRAHGVEVVLATPPTDSARTRKRRCDARDAVSKLYTILSRNECEAKKVKYK